MVWENPKKADLFLEIHLRPIINSVFEESTIIKIDALPKEYKLIRMGNGYIPTYKGLFLYMDPEMNVLGSPNLNEWVKAVKKEEAEAVMRLHRGEGSQ